MRPTALESEAIDAADDFQQSPSPTVSPDKPRLLVENCSPDRTVGAMRDILAAVGRLFDRGVPVRLVFDQMQRGRVAQVLTADGLVRAVHAVSRPYVLKAKPDGTIAETDARLSRSFAVMYLDWRGEWRLRPLNGIATAPLLQENGTFQSTEGYDSASGIWCENLPDLTGLVPEQPTKEEAASALRLIRDTWNALKNALGTSSSSFVNVSLLQLQAAARLPDGPLSEVTMNAALAMIEAAAPQNEIEGALAVQMACTHCAAMFALSRVDGCTQRSISAYSAAAAKLLRAYTMQVEALRRLRSGGAQHVRVEHVHINDQARALIGPVSVSQTREAG